VSSELKDETVLRDMIVAIAGKGGSQIPKDREFEVLLSEDRVKPFIMKVTRDMLRDGVEIKSFPGAQAGLKVKLKGEDLEIDLTEKAVTDLLVQHLLPKYRKIVRGQE
jgi:V/A-type H+/Na+-transporting ATPase subunit E